MKVKSWQPVFKMLKPKHRGNNISRANVTAIQTYNAIEGDTGLNRKYAGLKGLFEMRRGRRV